MYVFSPISHTHPIKQASDDLLGELRGGYEVWEPYDRAFLRVACNRLVVIDTPGWERSRGVQGEMDIAKELDIPTYFVDENGDDCNRPNPVAPDNDLGCFSGCGLMRKPGGRGLCAPCYSYLAKQVKLGEITWEECEAKGWCKTIGCQGGWQAQSRKHFLSRSEYRSK